MDTIKILLGATVALLLGALGVSLSNMKKETAGAGKKELEEIQRQLNEIRVEQDRLAVEKARLDMQQSSMVTAHEEARATEDLAREAAKAELARIEEQRAADAAASAASVANADRDKKLANEEGAFKEGKEFQAKDKESRNASMVANALLIGRIKEWVSDESMGDFGVVEVLRPENVQNGSVLLVRRNTGVLGKLRVGEISVEGAVVNPVTVFSELKPQVGDELILEPPFYNE